MLNTLKILFAIIFWLLVTLLLYVTFFISQYTNNNDLDLRDIYSSEVYNLYLSWSGKIDMTEEIIDTTEGVFFNELNYTDSIYFSNKDTYEYAETKLWNLISVDSWIFVLNLNDLTKNYKIIWEWFELEPLWWGIIYIDTTGLKTLIFSLSSTVNLKFKDKTWDKEYSNIYMFPHSYFKFDINKNDKLENVDLFRIDSIRTNWYFSDDIFYSERLKVLISDNWYDFNNLEEVFHSDDFKELLFDNWYNFTNIIDISNADGLKRLFSDSWYNLFNIVKNHLKEKSDYFSSRYMDLEALTVSDFPWKEYMEKYMNIFINDAKKASYYKSIIFNDLILLLNSDKIEEDAISRIKLKLVELEKLSYEDYEEMNNIIKSYYKIISNHKFIDKISNLDNYTLLISKLNWINLDNEESSRSYIYLRNLYAIYDFTNFDKSINTNFFVFINNFYKNLEVLNNQVLFVNKTNKILMESLLFFLEDYMWAHLFSKLDEDISSDISILDKYMLLNRTIYFSTKNEVDIRTGLNRNVELLIMISDFFKSHIFDNIKDERGVLINYRDEEWLLVDSTGETFELDDVLALEVEKKVIFDLFYDNRKYLESSKENELIKIYEKYKDKIDEYFLALINLAKYKDKYSKESKNLFNYTVFRNDEKVYDKEYLNKYLSSFNNVNTEKIIISQIPNKEYLIVKNFIVNEVDVSFIIFPKESFRIESIKIDWVEKNFSYELEEQEKIWDQKYKLIGSDDERNDFKNFFTYTFFYNPSDKKDVDIIPEEIKTIDVDENKSIAVFKRISLLWERWEFSSLNNILEIEYTDLIVKSLEDITLSWAILNIKIGSLNYKSDFISKYYIKEEKENNYFYQNGWILLKVYNYAETNGYMFWWRYIKVMWKVYKKDFESTFTEISWSYAKVGSIINSITYNFYNVDLIDIKYILKSKIVSFKFENNQKSINISLLWDNIVSVLVDWKEYLTGPIKYNSLRNILWQIK